MISWLLGPEGMGDYNQWDLVATRTPEEWETALLAFGVLFLLLFFWINLRKLRSRATRLLLFGLRVLFLAGLVALWFLPAVQLKQVIFRKGQLLILADTSRSMSLPAAEEGRSRLEQVAEFIRASQPVFAELSNTAHLTPFVFDQTPRSVPFSRLSELSNPTGEFTSLSASLDQVVRGAKEGEVMGVILLSDGVENPAPGGPNRSEVLARLKAEKIPVFAFGVGSKGGVADLGVKEVHYDGFAFVHNKLTIEAVIALRGLSDRTVTVTLETEGRPLASQEVELKEGETKKAVFSFTPTQVGRGIYTVSVPHLSTDAIPQNDRQSFLVDVIRDKIRVLHVCGHPSYDEQFFRRYLKGNPNVDLISFFILRTNADYSFVPEEELSLIPFPTEELFAKQIHTFDVVVFQNFTYQGYQMETYLPNIARYVLDGGALLVIGGDVSYGMGGYMGTPIEEVLPFDLAPVDPPFSAEAFKMKPTESGLRHPVMQFAHGAEINRNLIESLPEAQGLNLGLRPKPDAVVLAEHPTLQTDGRPAPVIALSRPGRGRVAALTIDSSWRWHFLDAMNDGDGTPYRTFFNNTLRWLIKDPELKRLVLSTPSDAPRPGEKIELEARLLDEDFNPKPEAKISIRILQPSASLQAPKPVLVKEVVTDSEGIARLSFDAPAREGSLKVEAIALRDTADPPETEPPEKDELLLSVISMTREFDEVGVDFDRLRELAASTGGRFLTLPHALSADDIPLEPERTGRVGKKKDIPLWDNLWTLLLLSLPILLEWWLRKRHRLN